LAVACEGVRSDSNRPPLTDLDTLSLPLTWAQQHLWRRGLSAAAAARLLAFAGERGKEAAVVLLFGGAAVWVA
jgi:hypothetical protein